MSIIIEICLIIITVILVIRSLVELVVILGITKKILPILDRSKETLNNIKDVSQYIKEESDHIKSTIHTITEDTRSKMDTFKEVLGKINQNLLILNSALKGIVETFTYFFKKGDKEKSDKGDLSNK